MGMEERVTSVMSPIGDGDWAGEPGNRKKKTNGPRRAGRSPPRGCLLKSAEWIVVEKAPEPESQDLGSNAAFSTSYLGDVGKITKALRASVSSSVRPEGVVLDDL